ncbi:MAG: sirohydrochlorin cobaltochelatase [Porphyromonadaceae bacterium]|nr:sirohydrochlorin cobaltochelatase [Porphyromonadaceae bacterium]
MISTGKAIAPIDLERQHNEALLLITFGSTYPGPHKTFARIRTYFAQLYPERDIFMAFTSSICMRRWYDKTGEQYYPADQWLEAIGQAGYKQVSLQSLHIIPGLEYSFITQNYIPAFQDKYPHIRTALGQPLLYSAEDIAEVGQVIYNEFSERLGRGEGLVLMGHGNHTDKFPEANGKYDELNTYLQSLDQKIVIGTVDYEAMLYEHVSAYLHEHCPTPATLNFLPLMSVAGDHALNDMVGAWEEGEPLEEQSWLCRLREEGYQATEANCHMHGLGDYDSICAVWARHLREAEREAFV